MLGLMPFAAAVLAEFGDHEGESFTLVDEAQHSPGAPTCDTGDFGTHGAQECCILYLLSPTTEIGRTWGHMPDAGRKRWAARDCDRYGPRLRAARLEVARHNSSGATVIG